jgi:hypothetical protein
MPGRRNGLEQILMKVSPVQEKLQTRWPCWPAPRRWCHSRAWLPREESRISKLGEVLAVPAECR